MLHKQAGNKNDLRVVGLSLPTTHNADFFFRVCYNVLASVKIEVGVINDFDLKLAGLIPLTVPVVIDGFCAVFRFEVFI